MEIDIKCQVWCLTYGELSDHLWTQILDREILFLRCPREQRPACWLGCQSSFRGSLESTENSPLFTWNCLGSFAGRFAVASPSIPAPCSPQPLELWRQVGITLDGPPTQGSLAPMCSLTPLYLLYTDPPLLESTRLVPPSPYEMSCAPGVLNCD